MALIGKYEILDQIGTGSMGTVYRARDTMLERPVALKVMRTGANVDPEIRERFYREARACARLQHPNIVAVFDLGEAEGMAYIAMELLNGMDWRKAIAERSNYTVETQIELMAQVCQGLAHAHGNGVVHRDVKPSNLFIHDETHAKILDFGIAKLPSSNLTLAGRVLGTPNYMAPEQILGRPCDGRCDLFSAAIVFFEMLSGVHPFQAKFIPRRIAEGEPERLRDVAPEMPEELERILGTALRKEADERYKNAQELANELRTFSGQAPKGALPLRRTNAPVSSATGARTTASQPMPVPIIEPPVGEDPAEWRMSEFLRLLHEFDEAMGRGTRPAADEILSQMRALEAADDRFHVALQECGRRLQEVFPQAAQPEPAKPAPVVQPSPPPAPLPSPPPPPRSNPDTVERQERSAVTVPLIPTSVPPKVAPKVEPSVRAGADPGETALFKVPERSDPIVRAPTPAPVPAPEVSTTGVGTEVGGTGLFRTQFRTQETPAQAPPVPERRAETAQKPQPAPVLPKPPREPPKRPSGSEYDRLKKKYLAIGAVVIVGTALLGYLAFKSFTETPVAESPWVATATVTARSTNVMDSPAEGADRVGSAKRGDELHILRLPRMRSQEWVSAQLMKGKKAQTPGYVRIADLGGWTGRTPETALDLLLLFGPEESAAPAALQDQIEKLRQFVTKSSDAAQNGRASLEMARLHLAEARRKKADNPAGGWQADVQAALERLKAAAGVPDLKAQAEQMQEQAATMGLAGAERADGRTSSPRRTTPAPPAGQPTRASARELIEQARRLWQAGDYQRAINVLEPIRGDQEAAELLEKVRRARAVELGNRD